MKEIIGIFSEDSIMGYIFQIFMSVYPEIYSEIF